MPPAASSALGYSAIMSSSPRLLSIYARFSPVLMSSPLCSLRCAFRLFPTTTDDFVALRVTRTFVAHVRHQRERHYDYDDDMTKRLLDIALMFDYATLDDTTFTLRYSPASFHALCYFAAVSFLSHLHCYD